VIHWPTKTLKIQIRYFSSKYKSFDFLKITYKKRKKAKQEEWNEGRK